MNDGFSRCRQLRRSLGIPTCPMLLLGPRNLRQFTDVLNHSLAKFLANNGQQPTPHAIAKERNIPIRRILPPDLPPVAQKFQQCSTPKAQQGSHNLAKHSPLLLKNDPRMNTRKSPNACAAKNTQQHRLRLVIESVRRHTLQHATLPRQPLKKTVAQFTRRRLDARAPAPVHRRVTSLEFKLVLPRQFHNKALIRVRLLAPQLVIDLRTLRLGAQLLV